MNECFKESKGYRVPKENLDLAFGKDGTILVIENPTRDYFGALYIVSKELRGLATTKDLYFWQADEATHDSMKEALLKNFGIKIKDPYCGIYYKDDTFFVMIKKAAVITLRKKLLTFLNLIIFISFVIV